MFSAEHKWYMELTSPGTAHMIGVERFIRSFRTAYQQVDLADTKMFGRILILDGKIQSAENDEYIYHEALVHPAMLFSPRPRRVLVIGGGEGATLREVLKHPMVERLIMVDLDREVVELCREYLPSWHKGSFDDRRLELVIADARDYLTECSERFDVIISDVPEPVEDGPALKLFTRQYFKLVADRLTTQGIIALQGGDFSLPFLEAHCAISSTIRSVMPGALSYRAFIPSFNTDWSFILAAPDRNLLPDYSLFDQLIGERKLDLRFFDGETAAGMFSLPRDIREKLDRESRIIDDENLLTIF